MATRAFTARVRARARTRRPRPPATGPHGTGADPSPVVRAERPELGTEQSRHKHSIPNRLGVTVSRVRSILAATALAFGLVGLLAGPSLAATADQPSVGHHLTAGAAHTENNHST